MTGMSANDWVRAYTGLDLDTDVDMSENENEGADLKNKKGKIPISEFYGPVLQGEGPYIGLPTHFLRTAGCDYKCAMCDSMHAVDPQHPEWNPKWLYPREIHEELTLHAKKTSVKTVTLTGGNPAIHKNLESLVEVLKRERWNIHLETQGTIWNDWIGLVDSIVISPKVVGMGEKFEEDKFKNFLNKIRKYSPQKIPPKVAIKIPCFSKDDVIQAFHIFELVVYQGYGYGRIPYEFFISLGNPDPEDKKGGFTLQERIDMFISLEADLIEILSNLEPSMHWLGSKVRLLPQLHVLMHGTELGR